VFNTSKHLTSDVLAAAVALSGKLQKPERYFDERTLELASKYFKHGIGLRQLILEAAWANGYAERTTHVTREALRYAFMPSVEASWSTIDIEGILKGSANKFLLDGWNSVENTWRAIAAITNVVDFKVVTRYRLTVGAVYEKVPPGGELKHGTLGEEAFTIKADTYGLMLAIDRQTIVNDDLGAITDVPRQLGRAAALKLNDVFWTTFLDNASFFTAANKNLLTGGSSALSIDALDAAEVLFRSQTDPTGHPVGVMPRILLVPPQLNAKASQIYNSAEIRDTTGNTKYAVSNPFQGRFAVHVSAYLSNTKYVGASAKAWYLLADPADLAVIEVAFLNGQESPTIETADADFNTLGIQMRGYHDFGVALRDWRAGVKATGE
jgi:hypothetical protein